jgi:hypothetical protein
MSFDFKTLFEIPLTESTPENGKTIRKIARITQGSTINKRNNVDLSYHINRLEFRTILNGNPSICVSLNFSDFIWFIKCLKQKTESSVHAGKRILLFCDIGDTSVAIANVNNDLAFGIVLSAVDLDIILKNEGILGFLLKNQNLSGSNLKDMTLDLYISIIAKEIKTQMQKRCKGCENSNDEHICNGYVKDFPDIKAILQMSIFKPEIEGEFNQKFVRLMDLMNVKTGERLTQTQIHIPEIKSDEDFLLRRLTTFINLNDQNKNLDTILELCYP